MGDLVAKYKELEEANDEDGDVTGESGHGDSNTGETAFIQLERQIAAILKMMLLGLCDLHAKHRVHGDLKAGNVLVDGSGRCKLADFGVSVDLTDRDMAEEQVLCVLSRSHLEDTSRTEHPSGVKSRLHSSQ